MTMRLALAAWLLGCGAIGFAPQQTPVFHGETDVVALDVTVQDGKNPVLGLGPRDFGVRDNSVPQLVTDVSYGRLPIDLRLVFDTSGSISDAQLQNYLQAMTAVTSALQPDDRCDILSFSARMIDAATLQHSPVTIDLRRAEPNATSFFDMVSLALITAPTPGRRQLTIVMSDAADNASFFDERTLLDVAKRTDAVVYAIAPTNKPRGAAVLAIKTLKDRLETLASTTGGTTIESNRDLSAALLAALDEFRKSYVVVYTATGVARPGWHDLAVTVRGSKKYTVRTRRGYVGTGLFSTDPARSVPEVGRIAPTSGS
jgi:VWFA-related protein